MKKSDLELLANNCISEIQKRMADTKTNASGGTSGGLFAEVSDYQITILSNRGGFANVEAGQSKGIHGRTKQGFTFDPFGFNRIFRHFP